MVVYNIQEKDYNKKICVRPFIEYGGKIYYGVPFESSIYEVAKDIIENNSYTPSGDNDLNGKNEDDWYNYVQNIVDTVDGTNN